MSSWSAGGALVHTPAKLNLSLHILGRRPDGYHLLDSIVAPITIFDRVSVRVTPSSQLGITLRCSPADAAPLGPDNLAWRAAALFFRRHESAATVTLDVIKQIPSQAGLGGGSSDAAAVLRALNALCPTPVPTPDLIAWGLELGADIPLFLVEHPARMRGIGEQLEPCAVPTTDSLVVVYPGVGLDTQLVYAKYDDLLTMKRSASSIRALTSGQGPLRSMMHNDLEAAAFHLQPSLLSLKQRLLALGAAGALMTGSGSAIFGVWTNRKDAQRAAEQLQISGLWARVARVLERAPAVELVAA
jgi:4-diphosphocytidyl-2-C-methyl-D-erythritol kinase